MISIFTAQSDTQRKNWSFFRNGEFLRIQGRLFFFPFVSSFRSQVEEEVVAKESKEGGKDKFSTSLISKSNGSNRLQRGDRHKKSYKQWGRKRGGTRSVQCVCVLLSESIDGGSEKKVHRLDFKSNGSGLLEIRRRRRWRRGPRSDFPKYVFKSTIVAERGSFICGARRCLREVIIGAIHFARVQGFFCKLRIFLSSFVRSNEPQRTLPIPFFVAAKYSRMRPLLSFIASRLLAF